MLMLREHKIVKITQQYNWILDQFSGMIHTVSYLRLLITDTI